MPASTSRSAMSIASAMLYLTYGLHLTSCRCRCGLLLLLPYCLPAVQFHIHIDELVSLPVMHFRPRCPRQQHPINQPLTENAHTINRASSTMHQFIDDRPLCTATAVDRQWTGAVASTVAEKSRNEDDTRTRKCTLWRCKSTPTPKAKLLWMTSHYGPTVVRSVTEIPFHVFIW